MSRHALLLSETQRLFGQRLYAPAERGLKKALKGGPEDYPLYEALAYGRHAQGDAKGAMAFLEKAAKADPKQPGATFNLGVMLAQAGRHGDAAAAFRTVIGLAPDNPSAWLGCGDALAAVGENAAAIAAYDGALRYAPGHPGALIGRGAACGRLGKHEEALAAFDAVLAKGPNVAPAHYNRGRALAALERFDEALAAYERAIALKSDHVDAWINRGVAQEGLGQREAAMQSYQRAAETAQKSKQDESAALFNQSALLLSAGDYAKGFALYDKRYAQITKEPERILPGVRFWDGAATSERMRLWCEQGVGDQILFSRLIPLILARAPNLSVECDPRLVSLLQRTYPNIAVRALSDPARDADLQLCISDAPAMLGLANQADIPAPPAWVVDGACVGALRARYTAQAQGRPIIGIAWASKASTGKFKAAPLSEWGALLSRKALFVSLQYGEVAEDVAAARAAFNAEIMVDDSIDQMKDLEGFFAQIAALDHVVTISNTTAHVAGALAKPAYVMAPPGRGLHWYWGLQGERCTWHPSLTIVRRGLDQSWRDQIGLIANALALEFANP